MADVLINDERMGVRRRWVEVAPGEYAEQVVLARALPIRVRDGLGFYASGDGGRTAFNASTDIVLVSGSGEQSLAALVNPATSGLDLVLWFGEFSSSANSNFRRYRGSAITPTGLSRPIVNMGGGPQTSKAGLYIGGPAPTFTGANGTVSKTAQIGAYAQYVANIAGSVRLRPGNTLRWTVESTTVQNYGAAVYLEWAEIPAMP